MIRCIILDKIKRVLFCQTFDLGSLKILLQNFIFYTKRLCYSSSYCVLFWGKKSKWTNSYEKHTHTYTQDFINVAKSLISHKMQEKWDGKVTARYTFQNKCYFSIFYCPLFLGMWKNALKFQNAIAIIFHIFFNFLFLNVTIYWWI